MPPRRGSSGGSSKLQDVKVTPTSVGESANWSTASRKAAASERARERKLRDDPLVTVQSPQLVVCRRCGASIKLSLKSAFDPFHWQRHRERCLKRPDAVVRELRDANDKTPAPDADWPADVKDEPACDDAAMPSRASGASTPPLVEDTDEDGADASSAGGADETPSPVVPVRALSPFSPFDPETSPLAVTCELGSQAFARWQSLSQRSYDASVDLATDAASADAEWHGFDPLYWPPRVTFQESQLRSTS
ncbi:hypothetical protein PsYK624_142910 [Phanerochaete sordida]|uniref:Uncharacterized protein n=1 Tax=Phanerochaete sordida TaxID=48140 RepID=A0A9P3GPQ7_9APHY|nr:hypothetical protein PsYK624_142910 [Phanerochaete sordida]